MVNYRYIPQQLKKEYQAIIDFKKQEQRLRQKMYLRMYHLKGYELADYFLQIERKKFEILKKIEAFKIISKLKEYDYNVFRYITTDISTLEFDVNYKTMSRKLNRIYKVYTWCLTRL